MIFHDPKKKGSKKKRKQKFFYKKKLLSSQEKRKLKSKENMILDTRIEPFTSECVAHLARGCTSLTKDLKFESYGVFGNLKNQVNMVQSKTSYVNGYENELVFY